jgi:hypothetical protein
MGCQPYKQKFIHKLKRLSNDIVDERVIEQIALGTSCKL